MKQYKSKAEPVTAIQLTLDTVGLMYQKWGAPQLYKPDDWLVSNRGEVYSIDAETFAQTYKYVSDGRYIKTTKVYAVTAVADGRIATKEGFSVYKAGDMLVYNNADGTDGYCMTAMSFFQRYE